MRFGLGHFLRKYGSLAASAATVAAALIIAAVPSEGADGQAVAAYCGENVPQNHYRYADEMTRKQGTALFVDGRRIAVAENAGDLEVALDVVALELASAQYADADTYSIAGDVMYVDGEFLGAEFDDDLVSAIRSAELEVYGVVTKNVTAVLDSATLYYDNADMPEGREKVLREGSDGTVNETYLLYYSDGRMCGSELVFSDVIVEPVNTVVERGVKLSSDKTLTSLAMFIMPYNGGISSEYGRRNLMGGYFHGGLDIAGKTPGSYCYGDAIVASGDGVVVEAGWHGDFGKLVVIEHSNGIRTYYAHMSSIAVSVGDKVLQGDHIGNIGTTGLTEGPHVHFEVRLPDERGVYYRVDPKYYVINYSSYLRN